MEKHSFDQGVIDRLLVAKNLLEKIRTLPISNPDRYTIARHILTAHDAAELAIAGIAHHLNVLPKSTKTYLMDYFQPISETHPGEDMIGRHYFSQLNLVRIGIKHNGIFPDPKQWFRVGENTYDYISSLCEKYLNISFDDIDESDMITEPDVKHQYDIARELFSKNDYKSSLENIGLALYSLFESNRALRNLRVGEPRAEDALKLSAFGVHANEFLALQEFLPKVYFSSIDNEVKINWEQEKYGHPANWRQNATEFCLKTFVNVALRIQDAEWIPGVIEFKSVYEHKITALVDGVEIIQERLIKEKSKGLIGPTERVVVRTLKKGESIRGEITKKEGPLMAAMLGEEHKPVLSFMNYKEKIWGEIEADKVSVTCVPKDNELVKKYFPSLAELEYK
jgi:hypothetical protein